MNEKRPREGEDAVANSEAPPEKLVKVADNVKQEIAPTEDNAASGAPLWGSFTREQRVTFYQTLCKFGMSDPKWKNVELALPGKSREEILAYVAVFMLHLTDASLGVFAHLTGSLADEGVPQTAEEVKTLMERLAAIHLVQSKAKKLGEELDGGKAWLAKVRKANEIKLQRATGRIQAPLKWPVKMDMALLKGVGKYGYEQWNEITASPAVDALTHLCPLEEGRTKALTWGDLTQEEKQAVTALVKARLMDLVWMTVDEFRTSHAEGTAGMLEDEARATRSAGILEEKIERRRQMVDEWAYHEPMVGNDFQAVPPRLFKECKVNRTSGERRKVCLDANNTEGEPGTAEGRLVWDGHKHTDAVAAEWLRFVDDWVANAMTPGSELAEEWEYRPELALELLHNNSGDVERAVHALPLGPTIICRRKTIWSQPEIDTFISAFNHYGKDFHAITAMLSLKNFKEVTNFYFDHKWDEGFFDQPGAGDSGKANGGYQELTSEEQQLSLSANLPAVKLLAVKKKLVAESARMGKISRKQAYEISNLDNDTTDKVFELLCYRQLIKAADENA